MRAAGVCTEGFPCRVGNAPTPMQQHSMTRTDDLAFMVLSLKKSILLGEFPTIAYHSSNYLSARRLYTPLTYARWGSVFKHAYARILLRIKGNFSLLRKPLEHLIRECRIIMRARKGRGVEGHR